MQMMSWQDSVLSVFEEVTDKANVLRIASSEQSAAARSFSKIGEGCKLQSFVYGLVVVDALPEPF